MELIKKPIVCIEYVALHEIAHLRHPNHSKDFYYHIERYMPDYRKREKLLNGIIIAGAFIITALVAILIKG